MRSRTTPILLAVLAFAIASLTAACNGEETEPSPTVAATEVATSTPVPLTATETPPPGTAPPTVPPSPQTSLAIVSPTDGQAVPMLITLEFDSPESAYVLVRPIPSDPNQDYWVQAAAASIDTNHWQSYPVYVGIESDRSGLPFKLCVVISGSALSRGQRLRELPEGPSHCVAVTRQ